MSIAASLFGTLSTALSYFSSGKDILDSILEKRNAPFSVAFRNTVEKYEDEFPAIAYNLSEFLCADEVRNILPEVASLDAPDLKDIVDVFVNRTHFFLVDRGTTLELANSILTVFLTELRSALLHSPSEAPLVLDRKLTQYHHEQINLQQEQLSLQHEQNAAIQQILFQLRSPDMEGLVSARWDGRIEDAVYMAQSQGPRVGEMTWKRLLLDAEADRDVPTKILYKILTNLSSCLLSIGDMPNAKTYLTRAYQLQPNDNHARLNHALVEAIGSNFAVAHGIVDEVMKVDNNERVIAVKAQILFLEGRYTETISLFAKLWNDDETEFLSNESDCCRVLGQALYEIGQYSAAEVVLERGVALVPTDPWLKETLAYTIFNAMNNQLGFHNEEKMVLVEKLLCESIDEYKRLQINATLPQAFINRAVMRMRLGDESRALQDATEGLNLAPDNNEIQENYTYIHLSLGLKKELLPNLEDWAFNKKYPWAIGALLDVCRDDISEENLKKIKGLVEEVFRNTDVESLSWNLPRSLFQAYFEFLLSANQTEDAELLLKGTRVSDDMMHLLWAKLHLKHGNTDDAINELDFATQTFDRGKNQTSLFEVARIYASLEEWKRTAHLLRMLEVNEWSPPPIVRLYLQSMLNSFDPTFEDEILNLCNLYTSVRGKDKVVTQILIATLEARRDLPAAEKVWSDLVQDYPEVYEFQVGFSRCLIRMGKVHQAEMLLSKAKPDEEVSAELLMQTAYLFYAVKEPVKALRTGFEAWYLGKSDREINFGYFYLFTVITQEYSLDLEVDKVHPGTAVSVSFDGLQKRTFLFPFEYSLVPDQPEAIIIEKLSEGRPGETIPWSDGLSVPKSCTILSIQHMWVWGFQEAYNNHSIQFPDDPSIQQIPVESDLRSLLEMVDRHHQFIKSTIGEFASKPLPFAALAKMLHRNIFETWSSVVHSPDLKIRYSSNQSNELDSEVSALRQAKSIVVDPLSLLTLQYIKMTGTVSKLLERVVIPHSAYECLKLCHDSVARTKQHMVIGKLDGGYFKQEVSAQSQQLASGFLAELVQFCEQNEIVSRPRSYSEFESSLCKALGEEFVMPIPIAESLDGAIYYTDDVYMRQFISNQYGIAVCGTSAILEHAKVNCLVTQQQVADIGIQLLRSQYSIVPISKDMLLTPVINTFTATPDYLFVADHLVSGEYEPSSAIRVMASFCREILMTAPLFVLTTGLLTDVLERISRTIGIAGATYFRRLVVERHGIIELPALNKADEFITDWIRQKWPLHA